jgi:hypothetical protein
MGISVWCRREPFARSRCSTYVTHGAKIRTLARTLIGKHGRGARDVAHKRAEERLGAHDYKVAAVWSEVADAVITMGVKPRGPVSREPPLADVVDDGLTKAVMDADRVDRKELEGVLGKATRKMRRR